MYFYLLFLAPTKGTAKIECIVNRRMLELGHTVFRHPRSTRGFCLSRCVSPLMVEIMGLEPITYGFQASVLPVKTTSPYGHVACISIVKVRKSTDWITKKHPELWDAYCL